MSNKAFLEGYLDKSAARPRMTLGPESLAIYKGSRPGIHLDVFGDTKADKGIDPFTHKTYPGLGSRDN